MSSETEFANRAVHPSKSCRFCKKSLTYIGSKVPRVSVFNVVKNKELLAYTGTESVVLPDVVGSLGHKLQGHEVLSEISCLTCARTLTRVYATFTKLVSHSNGGISSSTKRLCSNSPTGISPLSKRTREDGARAKSRRSLDLTDASVLPEELDKENSIPSAGISSLEDAVDSRKDLSSESEQQQTAIVTVRYCAIRSFYKSGSRDKLVFIQRSLPYSIYTICIWELFLCVRCETFLQICFLDGDFQFSLSISTQWSI